MKVVITVALIVATLAFNNVSAQFTLSCDSFCVLSIEMDTTQPDMLVVTILNDNAGHVNYPTIQVIDANGDTVAGDTIFNFFAHMGHFPLQYHVPTVLDSVPAGFTGTVWLMERIFDTVCVLSFPCEAPNAVSPVGETTLTAFPVPANDVVNVRLNEAGGALYIFDGLGRCVAQRSRVSESERIDVTALPSGLYLLRTVAPNGAAVSRVISIHH